MAITIYKRKLSNPNQWTLYLKINFKGQQWAENTGYRSGSGKYKNKDAEKSAFILSQKRHVELLNNEHNIKTKTSNLKEYFDSFIQLKSEGYQRKFKDMFKKFSVIVPGSTQLKKIDTKHLKEFTEYCELKDYSNSTIHKDLSMLRSIFLAAIEDGVIRKSPFSSRWNYRKIEVKKSILTKDELNSIIALDTNLIIDKLDNDYHKNSSMVEFVRDMFILQCFTGFRISDILSMDSKVDLHEDRIIKTMQKTGKVISIPLAPLAPLAKEVILKYQSNKVFKISSQNYNKNLKKIALACNIYKNVTSHTARHTFVTLLIATGVDIYTVKNMVGHGSVRTTELYAKLVDGKKEKAIAELGKYLEKRND